jgi:hypothetical protein
MHIHKFNDSCGKSIIYSDKPQVLDSKFIVYRKQRYDLTSRNWIVARRLPNTTGHFLSHFEAVKVISHFNTACKFVEQSNQFVCEQHDLL